MIKRPSALDAARRSCLSETAPLNLSLSNSKTGGWTDIVEHMPVQSAPYLDDSFLVAACQVGSQPGHGLLDISTSKDDLFVWAQMSEISGIQKLGFPAANTRMTSPTPCLWLGENSS